MSGTLTSDITNADTQEFLKGLQRRGIGIPQFRRARLSERALDLIAEVIQAGTVAAPSPPRVHPPTPDFDRELARQIWQPVDFWVNDDCWHCEFTIANPLNKTRLLVGVSTPSSGMSVGVNLVSEDCPQLHKGQHRPYQHFCAIGTYRVAKVEYHPHPDGEYIDFKLHRPPGNNSYWLRIFRTGYFYFTAD